MDIDGDGRQDIVGGGRWFRNLGNLQFEVNLIDPSYSFSRAAAGQLKKGGRPEVVLVVGDGDGPLNWYEYVTGTWVPHEIAQIHYGHSLSVLDVDGDGNLDIFCAEQRLNGQNPDSKIYIFYGDGEGNFTPSIVDRGYDLRGRGPGWRRPPGYSRQAVQLPGPAPRRVAESRAAVRERAWPEDVPPCLRAGS